MIVAKIICLIFVPFWAYLHWLTSANIKKRWSVPKFLFYVFWGEAIILFGCGNWIIAIDFVLMGLIMVALESD